MSRDLIFRDADGREYQPVRHYNRKTGVSAYRVKPLGASNETDDCIELDSIDDVARAMLVDKLPARVKALDGGPVNYLKFGAQKLAAYELALGIAQKLGIPAISNALPSQADKIRNYVVEELIKPAREKGDTSIEIVSGDVHGSMGLQNALPAVCSVLEGAALAQQAKIRLIDRHSPIGSDKPSSTIRYRFNLENGLAQLIDRVALDRLKRNFLDLHLDFVSFADCPSFAAKEDAYKRAIIGEAERLVEEMQDNGDFDLGNRLIDLLAGRSGLVCNLIDWRAQKVVDNARESRPEFIGAATGRLARADDAIDAVITFVEVAWPTLRGDLASNPYAESRMFPTMLRALVDPQSVLPIRSSPTENAARMLLGEPAFANAPLIRDELVKVTAMAREMMRIMDEEWNWAPRDLWDIQGFIWETCQKQLRDDDMTDEELLHLFDSCTYFRTRRVKWSEEQASSFCRMARKAHDLGFDWYRTNIPQVRLGRKERGAARASGTVACFHAAPARIEFSHSSGDLGLQGAFNCDPEGEEAFAEALDMHQDKIANWLAPAPRRDGFWPGYDELAAAEENDRKVSKMANSTNLILYGPPGTGKTFATAREAVRLCDGEAPDTEDDVRTRYAELAGAGQIRFVTFHQSYSYEDFVEGLRPTTGREGEESASGGFSLEPTPGVFREIATVAEQALRGAENGEPFDMSGRRVFKMSLGRAGSEDHIFDAAVEGNYIVLGWGGEIDWSPYENYDAIHAKWNELHPGTNGNDPNIAQTARFRASMREGDLVVVSYGNNRFRAIAEVVGPYQYDPTGEQDYNHRRAVRWLFVADEPLAISFYNRPFMQWSCYLLNEEHLNRDALALFLPGSGRNASEPAQFVLICDEINRANISKVFGELITLIESDKRIGAPYELRLTLPYSKHSFGVPSNLHIVGTMNTADRSIALLDTALRRRFVFREIMPKPDLLGEVDGVNLSSLLTHMNNRIEYLFDREHQIGHALFMGCDTRAGLDDVLRFRVIPLLAEYFHEDWSKIGAVLGDPAGDRFLVRELLTAPPGIDSEYGGERYRWRVRDEFTADAYAGLQ